MTVTVDFKFDLGDKVRYIDHDFEVVGKVTSRRISFCERLTKSGKRSALNASAPRYVIEYKSNYGWRYIYSATEESLEKVEGETEDGIVYY